MFLTYLLHQRRGAWPWNGGHLGGTTVTTVKKLPPHRPPCSSTTVKKKKWHMFGSVSIRITLCSDVELNFPWKSQHSLPIYAYKYYSISHCSLGTSSCSLYDVHPLENMKSIDTKNQRYVLKFQQNYLLLLLLLLLLVHYYLLSNEQRNCDVPNDTSHMVLLQITTAIPRYTSTRLPTFHDWLTPFSYCNPSQMWHSFTWPWHSWRNYDNSSQIRYYFPHISDSIK